MKTFEILDLKKHSIWGGANEEPQKTEGGSRTLGDETYTYCYDWLYPNGDKAYIKDSSDSAGKDPWDVPR